jgi:hypothetical protein
MRPPDRRRQLMRILVAFTIAIVAALSTSGPAHAAPARNNSDTEPVYFIHGYANFSGGFDVCVYWCDAIHAIDQWGWAGPLIGVGYYADDWNFNVRMSSRTHETPIKTLGRDLAWMIYNRDTSAGRSVDLVGHSMGGLIIDAALTGVARREAGFPTTLYVEDVATLATPYAGSTWWTRTCATRQCRDMAPYSDFLTWLLQGPQSSQGTDWTLIGSYDDNVVSVDSATAMSYNVGHKHKYHTDGMEHDRIHHWISGVHTVTSWHHHTPTWRTITNAYSPIHAVRAGLWAWSAE